MLTKKICENLKNEYFSDLCGICSVDPESVKVKVIGRNSKKYYACTKDKVKIDFKGITWFRPPKITCIFLVYDFHHTEVDFFSTMLHELLHVVFNKAVLQNTPKRKGGKHDLHLIEESFIIDLEAIFINFIGYMATHLVKN